MLAVDLGDVEDATDVGVGHLARGAHLVEEAVQAVLVALQPLGQKLERHRLSQLHVVGAVDLAHAAAAEQADDAVALVQHGARDEAGAVEGRVRGGGFPASSRG